MSVDRPYVTVVGNCQAESLRKLLHSTGAIDSRRIPPVHEVGPDEMPALIDELSRTDVLVSQPIRLITVDSLWGQRN